MWLVSSRYFLVLQLRAYDIASFLLYFRQSASCTTTVFDSEPDVGAGFASTDFEAVGRWTVLFPVTIPSL